MRVLPGLALLPKVRNYVCFFLSTNVSIHFACYYISTGAKTPTKERAERAGSFPKTRPTELSSNNLHKRKTANGTNGARSPQTAAREEVNKIRIKERKKVSTISTAAKQMQNKVFKWTAHRVFLPILECWSFYSPSPAPKKKNRRSGAKGVVKTLAIPSTNRHVKCEWKRT